MNAIYLDHNATTPPHPDVIAAVSRAAVDAFGNPGSRHSGGRAARRLLEQSRETIAAILGADPGEVVFTSGGTEANNLAIHGVSQGRTGSFLALAGEHPSINEPLQRLQGDGWQRRNVVMTSEGLADFEATKVDEEFEQTVRFAVVQWAHNETGVVRDLSPWKEWCAARQIPWHVDAVQAAGRIVLDFRHSGATTMSIAAHKFRGPRGIGALLVRRGARLTSTLAGGHQEAGLRPGTECTALAAGMAKALDLWQLEQDSLAARMQDLRDRLEQGIVTGVPGSFVHAVRAPRLPNTTNIAFPGLDGDALLVALDLAGVGASLGSACASGSSEPAPILLAMGCTPEIARASIRFSVGWTNTRAEIEDAIQRVIRVARSQASAGAGASV